MYYTNSCSIIFTWTMWIYLLLLAYIAKTDAGYYSGQQKTKIGKAGFKCNFKISYSELICSKPIVKCNRRSRKSIDFPNIITDDAVLAVTVRNNKVISCSVGSKRSIDQEIQNFQHQLHLDLENDISKVNCNNLESFKKSNWSMLTIPPCAKVGYNAYKNHCKKCSKYANKPICYYNCIKELVGKIEQCQLGIKTIMIKICDYFGWTKDCPKTDEAFGLITSGSTSLEEQDFGEFHKTLQLELEDEISKLNCKNLADFKSSQCGVITIISCSKDGYNAYKNNCKKCSVSSKKPECYYKCIGKIVDQIKKCKPCIKKILGRICSHFGWKNCSSITEEISSTTALYGTTSISVSTSSEEQDFEKFHNMLQLDLEDETSKLNCNNLAVYKSSECGVYTILSCAKDGYNAYKKNCNKCSDSSNKPECYYKCIDQIVDQIKKCKPCIKKILGKICDHFGWKCSSSSNEIGSTTALYDTTSTPGSMSFEEQDFEEFHNMLHSDLEDEISKLNCNNLADFKSSQCRVITVISCAKDGYNAYKKSCNKCSSSSNKPDCYYTCIKKIVDQITKCKPCIKKILGKICSHFGWKFCSSNTEEISSTTALYGTTRISVTDDNAPKKLLVPCVSGVRKFASSTGFGHYYECQRGDKYPIEKQCSENEFWNRETMWCERRINNYGKPAEFSTSNGRTGSKEHGIYFEPVLGRSVMLGDLYDSRRNLALNGYSFWKYKEIKDKKVIKNKFYSNTNFFVEKNQDDRLKTFNIDAHLALSFLGGLVHVDGSAHYLKDSRDSVKTVRYNMMYDATTRTETLPMTMRENLTYNLCGKIKNDKSGPTHVITSIEYGMKAVFVFQTTITSSEDAQEIGGSLHVIINSIPELKINAEAKAKFTTQENKTMSSMNVKLFGDFILKNSPTTYDAAVGVYQNISHYLGDEKNKYNKSSPMKIVLMPVDQFCTDVELLMYSITADIMAVVTKMMSELDEEMVQIKTLKSNLLAKQFVDISEMIGYFETNLTIYKMKLETKLKTVLPEIRAGGGEEKLFELYYTYTKSPFNYYNAIQFLQERDRELNTIDSLFNDQSITSGYITVGDFALANINDALLHKTYVIIYWFRVLSNVNVTKEYIKTEHANTDTWYNNFTMVGTAGYKWREFRDFAIRNKNFLHDQAFFIKGASYNDKETLSEISVYKNGLTKTLNFKVPTSPPTPIIHSRSNGSVTLNVGTSGVTKTNKFVSEIFVNYRYFYQLLGKEVQSHYYNITFKIKEYADSSGKIIVPIDTPFERSVQIIKRTTKPKTTTTKTARTTKATTTTKTTTTAKPIKTTKIVSVTYKLTTSFQTPFGRGPDSDPLEIRKPKGSTATDPGTGPVLVVTGGDYGSTKFLKSEIISHNQVCPSTIPQLPLPCSGCQSVWIQDILLICGISIKCLAVRPGDINWEDNAKNFMKTGRDYFSLTKVNEDELVAAGGINGKHLLKSLEIYSQGTWKLMNIQLNTGTAGHCAVHYKSGGHSYLMVIGGSNTIDKSWENPFKSVLLIDLTTGNKVSVDPGPMPPLWTPACTVMGENIYVSGGATSGGSSSGAVYRYSLTKKEFTFQGQLNQKRWGHKMSVTGHGDSAELIVVGGFGYVNAQGNIETSKDGSIWKISKLSMSKERQYFAMASVSSRFASKLKC